MTDFKSDEFRSYVSNLLNESIAELNVSSFNELVKASGLNATLSALKPYMIPIGHLMVSMANENMGLEGDGLDAAFIPFLFTQRTIWADATGEIRQEGAVGLVHDCIYHRVHANPEFCLAMSHYSSGAICEVVNPDYECIWTHHLTNGDPYCRYVVKRKSDPSMNLEDLGNTLVTVPRIDPPRANDMDIEKFNMLGWWSWLTMSSVDLRGPDKTLEILCPIAERIGSKAGKSLVQKHPEFKDDVEAVGQLIDMVEKTMLGRMGSSRYLSNDEFVREVTECPMLVFSPPEMCKQTEAFYQGMCKSIDPDLEFHYEKMMTAGDDKCIWSLKRKSISAPPKEEKEIPRTSQTPLEVLKMRLAKGEVTKQEYEELRELLSK